MTFPNSAYFQAKDYFGTGATSTLTLIKYVINNDGGTVTSTDFVPYAKKLNPSTSFSYSVRFTSGMTKTVLSCTYMIGEVDFPGYYLVSLGADCNLK